MKMAVNRVNTVFIATSFAKLAELVQGNIFAWFWVSEGASLFAALCFTNFFHMPLAAVFTKFAKSSLEVLAHRLAIPQRQSNIGQLGGLGQICHFQKISEVRKLMTGIYLSIKSALTGFVGGSV